MVLGTKGMKRQALAIITEDDSRRQKGRFFMCIQDSLFYFIH